MGVLLSEIQEGARFLYFRQIRSLVLCNISYYGLQDFSIYTYL